MRTIIVLIDYELLVRSNTECMLVSHSMQAFQFQQVYTRLRLEILRTSDLIIYPIDEVCFMKRITDELSAFWKIIRFAIRDAHDYDRRTDCVIVCILQDT